MDEQKINQYYTDAIMAVCTFLKRDTTICGEKLVVGGSTCKRHRNTAPYRLCAAGCGKVASSRHGRSMCVKCDPNGAMAQSRSNRSKPTYTIPPLPKMVPASVSNVVPSLSAAGHASLAAALAALSAAEHALATAKCAVTAAMGNADSPIVELTDADVDKLVAELGV